MKMLSASSLLCEVVPAGLKPHLPSPFCQRVQEICHQVRREQTKRTPAKVNKEKSNEQEQKKTPW